MEDTRDSELSEKRLTVAFLPAAEPILADIEAARLDYEAARLSSLTLEERGAYKVLREKVSNTIKSML